MRLKQEFWPNWQKWKSMRRTYRKPCMENCFCFWYKIKCNFDYCLLKRQRMFLPVCICLLLSYDPLGSVYWNFIKKLNLTSTFDPDKTLVNSQPKTILVWNAIPLFIYLVYFFYRKQKVVVESCYTVRDPTLLQQFLFEKDQVILDLQEVVKVRFSISSPPSPPPPKKKNSADKIILGFLCPAKKEVFHNLLLLLLHMSLVCHNPVWAMTHQWLSGYALFFLVFCHICMKGKKRIMTRIQLLLLPIKKGTFNICSVLCRSCRPKWRSWSICWR